MLAAFTLPLLAQSPDLMSYQALAVQISILQGTPNGTSVFSEVNGIAFKEIRGVTGTTPARSYFTSFALPAGYTETNTRLLSFEINYLGDRWVGLGFDNADYADCTLM